MGGALDDANEGPTCRPVEFGLSACEVGWPTTASDFPDTAYKNKNKKCVKKKSWEHRLVVKDLHPTSCSRKIQRV